MIEPLGTSLGVWLGVTWALGGGAAFMTGQALAATWRPFAHALPYALLLGLGTRFLIFALFEGVLLSPTGYLLDGAVLYGIATAAYRMTRARKMAAQYPWLYEQTGLFSWRDRREG
ncbi:MAG: hypothetical protein HQL40_17765 [Alphaproteobacteria bacterium]|nr:hypothetical protein [Alphaproteobacteria bacterium]